MAKARLETVLTGDDTPFVRAVDRAEKRAATFSSRVERMFRRDPGKRAENALGGLVGDLATGNFQGALSVLDRVSGLPLALGVGIGAALIIFEKAKKQLEECDKAAEKLQGTLARPLSLQSALGPEGIGKEIEATTKNLEDLEEKRKGFFVRLRESAIRNQPGPYGDPYSQTNDEPDRVPGAAKVAMEAEKRIHELAIARGNAELEIVRIKEIAANKSEREGAAEKISLDYRQKRAALELEKGLNKPGRRAEEHFRSVTALDREKNLAVDVMNRRLDAREKEVALQSRILDLQTSNLTKSEQELVAVKEKIALLKQRIAGPGTAEEKRDWSLEAKSLQNQAYRMQYAQRFDGPALYTPEKGEQAQYSAWVKAQSPSGPDAYMRHPDAYTRHPDAYGGPDDPSTRYGHTYRSQLHPGKGDGGSQGATGIESKLDALKDAINRPDWVK